MVLFCSANNCTTKFLRGSGVSFHRFPTDLHMRKQWIIAIKREDYNPSKTAVLCSKHFKKTDYLEWFGPPRLKPSAVPSLCDFPQRLQKQVKERKSQTSDTASVCFTDQSLREKKKYKNRSLKNVDVFHQDEALTSAIKNDSDIIQCVAESNPEVPSKKRKRTQQMYLRDFTETDMNCPKTAKLMLRIAKSTVSRKTKEIKYLRCKTSRLQKRVQTLNLLLAEHLRASNKISDET